jgi:hypothetical protein
VLNEITSLPSKASKSAQKINIQCFLKQSRNVKSFPFIMAIKKAENIWGEN